MIERAVKSRKIEHLIHFTRFCNIENILKHGIIPRKQLIRESTAFAFNDMHRLDELTEASCFTLTHPNYKMFYPLRLDNPSLDWVVIRLKPSILWEKTCLFCPTNAANNSVRFKTKAERQGVDAFQGLFSEREGFPTRLQLGLADNEPTDVQSEVLVLDVVEPKYIVDILVDEKTKMKDFNAILKTKNQHKDFNFYYSSKHFYPRHDFKALKGV